MSYAEPRTEASSSETAPCCARIITTDYTGLCALMKLRTANSDVFNRIAFMQAKEAPWERHFLAMKDGDVIVGSAALQRSPYDDGTEWLKYISVDEGHRRQGIAKALVQAVFADVAARGVILQPSSFTKMGDVCLNHVMARVHLEHPSLRIRWGWNAYPLTTGERPYQVSTGMSGNRSVYLRREP